MAQRNNILLTFLCSDLLADGGQAGLKIVAFFKWVVPAYPPYKTTRLQDRPLNQKIRKLERLEYI